MLRFPMDISALPPFSSLGPSEIKEIQQRYFFPTTRYAKGTRPILRHDPYGDLLILSKGTFQAEINELNGKRMVVELLPGPQIIASAVYFSSQARFPVDLLCLDEVTVLRIPRPTVMKIMTRYPVLLETVLTDMGNRLLFLSQRLRMSHIGSIEKKLALFLCDQSSIEYGKCWAESEQGERRVHIHTSRQTLADSFGVARQSLARTMKELEVLGIIRVQGKSVHIIDSKRLYKLAHRE